MPALIQCIVDRVAQDSQQPSVSQLKVKLWLYMREVRAGREVGVTDRDQPVARLVPVKRPPPAAALRTAKPREATASPLGGHC